MHFGLSEEQVELVGAIETLVARRMGQVDLRAVCDSESGYDPGLWSTLCAQIGVAGLAIPEDFGGSGFSTFETHLVLEALGAPLTPTPLLGSALVATRAVLLCGSDADCARLLPSLADGSQVATLAWADQQGRWRTRNSDIQASAQGSDWFLDGVATLVLDAAQADLVFAVAQTESGLQLFEVDRSEGVRIEPTPALDITIRPAKIEFRRAPARPIGTALTGQLETLRAEAAIATTALQVGGAQGSLDRTIAHLQEREQFGRPLSSFQALKHRIADMLVWVESARSISWYAAWASAQQDLELPRIASTAKAWCSDAFGHVTSEMVQLHGGIAITWEHDAHLYFKRAHATGNLFGNAREHRRRLIGA